MKKLFILFTIFSATVNLSAQNFHFEPSNFLEKIIVSNDMTDLTIDIIRNQSIDTLYLEYELITNTCPSEWYTAYCDNHGCWGSLPDTGYMSPLYEDLNSYIRLSINPEGYQGSGLVEYYVYEKGQYEEGLLMSFMISTPDFVGIESLEDESLDFYPNPFSHQLNISKTTGISEINVFDITGKLIHSLSNKSISSGLIQTENWNKGLYFVEVIDEFGKKQTRKLSKY